MDFDCGWCKYSECIDGILFCHYIFDDVDMTYICENFKYYKDEN